VPRSPAPQPKRRLAPLGAADEMVHYGMDLSGSERGGAVVLRLGDGLATLLVREITESLQLVEFAGKLHCVHRNFDDHVALDFATPEGIDKLAWQVS
jgi:hypothetical protein